MQEESFSKNDKLTVMGGASKALASGYIYLGKRLLFSNFFRTIFYNKFKKKIFENVVVKNTLFPKAVQVRKYHFLISIMDIFIKNYKRGYISKKFIENAADNIIKPAILDSDKNEKAKEDFKKKYGGYPPTFMLLSPTGKCNLKCLGCYASSVINSPTLPWKVVDKAVSELESWGDWFVTISGGEPFMYKDSGKDIFDLFKKYNHFLFLVYTNSTLLTKEVAEKLATLGNVIPAISIEGFEKHTDARRGVGVHKKILEAISNLKKAGVPFCTSVTATKNNIDILLKNDFYDYVFQELGASFMWMYQLMPIGKAVDARLMIGPKERVALFRKMEQLILKRKYPIADFWNSGIIANGCIAYGRRGGYFYVDWNGNIMPCAFVPYYEDNIKDLYKKGKSLVDALFSKLFVNGRKWQEEYGLNHLHNPTNWLMPCSIRDNFANFKKNILTNKSKPQDPGAKAAMASTGYAKTLKNFDDELKSLTIPIWEKEFLGKK